ncbi:MULTISPECIES: META domain-containing protein [unclassified Streptomyces]|uniref:META domain-containing protein n=1 Tax=unclassified Streptomyces TaxID=2593676 RepID=UPI0003780574|nr:MULTISPECIES: META domain-containing protein [unclassified Streptomyces]MYT29303.1 META domain-containing protein [Streptomyces sp. SID8354]
MRPLRRALAPAVALVAALLTLTTSSAAPERADGGGTAARKLLGGPGDLLVGAVLGFDRGRLDGREFRSPDPTEETAHLGNWVEFHRDGTVSGTYGCTPFRLTADVRATDLTLTETGPKAESDGCPQAIANFEQQVGALFTGHLTLSERKHTPDDGSARLVDLTNDRGDYLTLSEIRPAQGFFDTQWDFYFAQYDDGGQYEGPKDAKVSWIFHEDGTMTGKLPCNDFTARAHFTGDEVTFSTPTLTTHRKCSEDRSAEDESWLHAPPPSTYGVFDHGSLLTFRPENPSGPEPGRRLEDNFKRAGSR